MRHCNEKGLVTSVTRRGVVDGEGSFDEAIRNELRRKEKGSEVSEARVSTRQASNGMAWLLYRRGRL